MATQSKPVLVMASVLAGANVFVAGTAFIDTVPPWVSGLASLLVATITVGWGVYVNGVVTPFAAVAARVLPSGKLVAGPAAPGATKEGHAVDVTKAAPPPVV